MPLRRRRAALNLRAPAINLDSAQVGDLATGDIAGGNIYNGVSPEHIVALMHEILGDTRQYRQLELTEREQRREQLDQELTEMRQELTALRGMVERIVRDIGQYREIGVSADSALTGWIRARLRWLRWGVIAACGIALLAAGLLGWHMIGG